MRPTGSYFFSAMRFVITVVLNTTRSIKSAGTPFIMLSKASSRDMSRSSLVETFAQARTCPFSSNTASVHVPPTSRPINNPIHPLIISESNFISIYFIIDCSFASIFRASMGVVFDMSISPSFFKASSLPSACSVFSPASALFFSAEAAT